MARSWGGYQNFYLNGKPVVERKLGRGRGIKRASMWDPKDFKGKTVLDIGCNYGNLAMEAVRQGATWVVGADNFPGIVTSREFIEENNIPNIDMWQVDVESREFKKHTPAFDVILFCAAFTHMRNATGMLNWIDTHCKETFYFETNSSFNVEKMMKVVKAQTNFGSYDLLGDSGDVPGHYSFFRCTGRTPEKLKEIEDNKTIYESRGRVPGQWEQSPPGWELKVLNDENQHIIFLPINKIFGPDIKKFEHRRERINYLKNSIKENSLSYPLLVKVEERTDGNLWHMQEGGHRYMALKELEDRTDIPCKIIVKRWNQ